MAAAPPKPFGMHPFEPSEHAVPGVKNGQSPASKDANGPTGHRSHNAHHKKKHRAAHKAVAYVFPTRTGDLAVSPGQITFEAEGNDLPGSPYFSRKIIWPGNPNDGVGKGSGVTIGRGYDMGDRTVAQVSADLVAAGLDTPTAAVFAKGAGVKGPGTDDTSAQGYVKNHRDECGTITTAVQKKLFENIYPAYVATAMDRYNFHSTSKTAQWGLLKPAIRDVLVDMVYQGFGKKEKGYGRPLQAGMNNDYQELINYIENNATMHGYEAGRHRADYLRAAMAAEKPPVPNTPPTAGNAP